MVVIGIDPHKSSHTAAAVDERSALLAQSRFVASKDTVHQLRQWAKVWPDRVWAVEGAYGLGLRLAQQLVAAGEPVVDVPAKLAARVRVLQSGHGRKTDGIDAMSVATAAVHTRRPRPVGAEDFSMLLRLLADRRDELNSERRRTMNRLHRLLRDLLLGGAPRDVSTGTVAALLSKIRPVALVDRERKAMARQLVADLQRIDRALAANRARCAEAVTASGTSLTQIPGISGVLAAKIIGHSRDVSRFPTAAHYASYTGTAPIEASSGDIKRHRLSRNGNRSLNFALHLVARTQLNHQSLGRTYYERKLAEHKTPNEAFRSLKLQLAKDVYRQLCLDHHLRLAPALT